MKKNLKKMISLTLAFALVFCVTILPVSAETVVPTGEPVVLASMSALYAEEDLVNYLSDSGISLQSNDQLFAVSVPSSNSSDSLTALQVVKKSGVTITNHFIFNYDDNGNEVSAPIAINPNARAINTITWSPGNGSIIITAAAQYSLSYIGTYPLDMRIFMNPQGLSFSYKYNGGYVPVSSINMALRTTGNRCDSNNNYISSDYSYDITKYVSTPNANTVYSKTGSLPSGVKVEKMGYGAGIFLVMEATVDGRWDSTSRPVIDVS